MLEQLTVKGFRSLRDFELEIRPGLNVLVGPNGAGKTNIILLFEFLRAVCSHSVSRAVGAAGGVAQVFSKRGRDRFANLMEVSVSGHVTVDEEIYTYSYEFSLEFNPADQEVSFCGQRFSIHKTIDAERVLHLEVNFDGGSSERQSGSIDVSQQFARSSDWAVKEFQNYVKRGFFRQNSLSTLFAHSDKVTSAVSQDFGGRFVLNVVPSHVKKPEDSTRKPGIESDGSGVSSTLFAIKRKRAFFEEQSNYIFERPKPIHPKWQAVVDLIRVAVPSIESIDVVNDPFDNLLRSQITVGKGNRKSIVPLSAISDGTAKWISLILRLSTSRSALLLEEPENYLHPLMQREIVRLLRDSIGTSGFTIVSTHSETLLNAVRADELIVVSYGSRGTKAKRVTNADDVEAEINRTGFGLGYYYLADAVEAN